MKLSLSEENYIKSIYHLSDGGNESVNTSSLSEDMETKPASVTDMIRKLAAKDIVSYQKYYGATLSETGKKIALEIVRKHRLWEVFLVDKLGFNWDEVHEVAEQMEHIQSTLLIDRLDHFLGNPTMDPHGDPIPDKDGNIVRLPKSPLSEIGLNQDAIVVKVSDQNPSLLRHLDRIKVRLGSKLRIVEITEFDESLLVRIDDTQEQFISKQIADNIMIAKK